MAEDNSFITHFCRLTASDLRLLADLHATELTRARIQELKELDFPSLLALQPQDSAFQLTLQQLDTCIKEWPAAIPAKTLDDLASDFADIYLNGSFRGSPQESVWIDEEELTCQQPMFEVREWYAKHDLAVPDWRKMADDHLVNQLLFVAHLLDKAAPEQDAALLTETARFLDDHLLRWLLPFGQRVVARCSTLFYAALALTTALYAEQLRDLLADILNTPRPSREEIENRMKANRTAHVKPEPVRFYPGAAPSW